MKLNDIIMIENATVNKIIQFKYNKDIYQKIWELTNQQEIELFEKSRKPDILWFDEESFRVNLFGRDGNPGRLCIVDLNHNIPIAKGKKLNGEWCRNHDTIYLKKNGLEIYRFENKVPISIYFWEDGVAYIVIRINLKKENFLSDEKGIRFSFLKEVVEQFDISKSNGNLKIKKNKSECSTSFVVKEYVRKGLMKQIENAFAAQGVSLKFSEHFRQKEIIVAHTMGDINGVKNSSVDISDYITVSEYESVLSEEGLIGDKKNDVIEGVNQQNIRNHYWKLTEKRMICLTYKDEFLRTNFVNNVSNNYTILFLYCMNLAKECRDLRRNAINGSNIGVVEKKLYINMVDCNKNHKHIHHLFEFYLRKIRRQFQRDFLNEEEHKVIIDSSERANDCRLPLMEDLVDDPFVFISYSQKDYKSVYKIIDILYKQRVNIYYDRGIGLVAEKHWTESIYHILHHRNCIGFINFLSRDAIKSNPVLQEKIEAKNMGIESLCIALNHEKCSQIIFEKEVVLPEIEDRVYTVDELIKKIDIEKLAKIAKAYDLNREPEYIWEERIDTSLSWNLQKKLNWIEEDWIEIL